MQPSFLKSYAKDSRIYIGNFPVVLDGAINCVGSSTQFSAQIPFPDELPPMNYGCMNPLATNYNPLNTTDDGSCIIPTIVYDCGLESVNAPVTINGIDITSEFTGDVSTWYGDYTSCGLYTTPTYCSWLGQSGPFSYTYIFSIPINYLTFVLTGTGNTSDENFIFTTNGGGLPTLYEYGSCFSRVEGNVIYSGNGSNSYGGGGVWTVVNSGGSFTRLTISGDGGANGSLLALCPNSIAFQ